MGKLVNTNQHRGHHEGHYRLRKDGRWECQFTLPERQGQECLWQEPAGRARQDGGSARQGQEGHRPQRRAADPGPLPHDLAGGDAKPKLRPSTIKSYESYIRLHIVPALGDTTLGDLTAQDVQRFLNGRTKAGLSPRTVQYIRAILRAALGQALRWGYVERNVAALASPPRQKPKQIATLSADEAGGSWMPRETIDWECSSRPRSIPECARASCSACAGRTSTLRRARCASARRCRRSTAPGSSWSPRASMDGARCPCASRRSRCCGGRRSRFGPCGSTRTWPGRNGASSFPQPSARRSIAATSPIICSASSSAGLPRVTFHALRHTCGSLLHQEGVPARTIMEILGHSQITLTLGTYCHATNAMFDEAAGALGRALGGTKSA